MRVRSLFTQVFIMVFLCVMLPESILGQMGMATLSGTVTDPSGAVVPGAQVALQSVTENATRRTVTNAVGQYVIPAIPPGTYRLSINAKGFQQRTLTGILLASGQGSTLNVALNLTTAVQQVAVTAATPLLDTTTAAVGGEVTARQFTSLPLLGRNFTTLVDVLPGVTNIPSTDASYAPSGFNGDAVEPSVYGQRQRDNDITVDGATALAPNFTEITLFPPPEATAEMKVETGMDSGAYGWASGANINVVTKSGANQYHGDLWEYLQNGSLDARSYFLPSVGAYQWNQFGATFGGPLVIPHVLSKSKAWYVFAYYEGIRLHSPANAEDLVPTAAQLNGDFSGSPQLYNPYTTVLNSSGAIVSRQPFMNNQIPSTLLNPTALTLAKTLYPAPNVPVGVIPGVNYLNTAPAINTSDQWSARVDHQFGSKDAFMARYSDWRNPFVTIGLPSLPAYSYYRFTNVVASDTHTFNPTFLVTGRFALQRAVYNQTQGGPNVETQTGLISTFPAYDGQDALPALSIAGYAGLGQFFGIEGPQYYLSWTGDAQKIQGRHTIGFGGGYTRTAFSTGHTLDTECFDSSQTALGANSGNSLASFLLGLPYTASRFAGPPTGYLLWHAFNGYLQDTYRASSKLTLNLGLRWDYISPPIIYPGLGTFDFITGTYVWDTTNPITHAPANIGRGGYAPDYDGWQPRLGFAYEFTPKTVFRSSFGIFDNIYGWNQQSPTGAAWGNWPYSFSQSEGALNTGLPSAFMLDPFPGPPVASTTPLGCSQCQNIQTSSTRTPYVEEWSASLQRQFTPSLMGEADYFGSHGVKLNSQVLDNVAVTPGITPYQTRQPWPAFPPFVDNGFDEYMSWYDGLGLKLQKRYSRNLTFLISYTYSRAMDQMDGGCNGDVYLEPCVNATRYDIGQWKAPAGFSLTNMLSATYVYDIPGHTGNKFADAALADWELSGIISATSGVPFANYLSTDNENIGATGRDNEFPNLVCNPNAGFTRSAAEWFNTACYQLPIFGTYGNAGRHDLYSDPLADWDFALDKRWPLGKENRNLEFRAEFFNFLNGSTFDPPNDVFGTPGFGAVSTTTRQPGRVIQFALKFHF
jgi:Carboxypeptidase regulatory-like domain